MKIASFKLHKWRISNNEKNANRFMFAIIDESGLLEVEEIVEEEAQIMIFNTEAEAMEHIKIMNEDFCLRGKEKTYWYKNRGNKPIKIDTTEKRWKSRYHSLSASISKFLYQ